MAREHSVQSFYSRWATGYDLLATYAPGVRRVRRRAVDALDPAPGDVVVDVGCGTGANLPFLREAVGPEGRVVGVDFSPGVVARARDRAARWRNVAVVRGDARSLPASEPDAVFASFLVGMLADPACVLDDWLDAVGPDGRVGLLHLSSSEGRGRPLNPVYAALVNAAAPPAAVEGLTASADRDDGSIPEDDASAPEDDGSPQARTEPSAADRVDDAVADRVDNAAADRGDDAVADRVDDAADRVDDAADRVDARVAAAHDRLREQCDVVTEETALLGFVRICAGRRG